MAFETSEPPNPLQYWGWIPHLNSSFEKEVNTLSFRERIFELSKCESTEWVEVNVRDHQIDRSSRNKIFDGKIRIKFEISSDFQYGMEKGLSCTIKAGSGEASVDIVVYKNGLMKLVLKNLGGAFLNFSDDNLRIVVREPYFLLKKLFHKDIFHVSEDIHNTKMDSADDLFSIVESNETNAVDDLFQAMLPKFVNVGLVHPMGSKRASKIVDVWAYCKGYELFMQNFVICCESDEVTRNEYLRLIELNSESVQSIRQHERDEGEFKMQHVINKVTIPMWILSAVMTILAGSLFYGATQSKYDWYVAGMDGGFFIVILCIVMVILIPILLYLWSLLEKRL